MGCGSSSSSGTEQSNKVKNQQVVSKQEVGVNYNPTAAVIKSLNGQFSSGKTTNNDQSLSQDRTTTTNNVQSLSQDRTSCTNNDQSLFQDRTTSTNNDQSLFQDRTTSTNNDQSISKGRTTSTNIDQSLFKDRTTSTNNDQSLSEGRITSTSSDQSLFQDRTTSTNNNQSLFEGRTTSTNYAQSLSEGRTTSTNNEKSISEGRTTCTTNDQSLSQGQTTRTNYDQSLSEGRTSRTNNGQSFSQDRTTSTNNDQSLSEVRTTSTIDDQSLSQARTTSTNNDQSLSQDRTTSMINDQSLSQGRTITISKVKSRDLKLNYDDFKDIDEHARQAPRSVEKSIETLAKYLAKPAKNDIEVVRALYVWVCENIRYDTNAYFSKNLSSLDTSGKGVLTSKSSVCEGYANLFESLCQSLNITCEKISGYAKGYSYNPGDVITFSQETNHAWNAVRLDGVWRFIETTWGAGHLDKEKKFAKKFNNFFFLTSPENFIYDHFPYFNNNIEESKQWQLLEKQISIEEYTRKIRPSKEAKQYCVIFSSHPHEIILVNNSPCTIIVESSANPFQNCWFDFNDEKGSKCTGAAIMLFEGSKECKTTVRPPNEGKYTLRLHAEINNENTTLVEYIIHCETAEQNWKPYPNYRGFYGPTISFTERGFDTSCIKPCYTCTDGNFHLSLKTSSTPDVLVHLHDAENVDHKKNLLVEQTDTSVNVRSRLLNKGYYKLELFSKDGKNYTLVYTVLILNTGESNWKPFPKNTGHYGPQPDFADRGFETSCIKPFYKCKDGNFNLSLKTTLTTAVLVQLLDAENVKHKKNLLVEQTDTSVNIRSRLLNKGYYKLELFSEVDEEYTLVYTVLILNTGESNWKPFPKNTGNYGINPDFIDSGLGTSCIKPFYECTDGNFHLSMKTTSTPDVLVQLHDAANVDHKDYLMIEQNDSSINIRSRLLNKGYYKLELFSNVDEEYTLACTVLILNTGESDVKSMFPITYTTTTKYKCKLFQPLVRELPPNSEIFFEFNSPAFESILANNKIFSEKSGEKWTVTVTTGESGELSLSGKPYGESSYWPVYTFVINS